MKTIHLLMAAVVTAGASLPLQAQDVPKLIPLPSAPTVPPRSDKVQVNPSNAVVNPTITPAQGERLQQLGSQQADARVSGEARDALVQIVNAATRENGFVDLVGHIASQDRTRLGDVRQEKLDDLHKTVAEFREAYRARYHQDFVLKADHLKEASVNVGKDQNALTVSLSGLEKSPATSVTAGNAGANATGGTTGGATKDIQANTGLSMVAGPTLNLINESAAGTGGATSAGSAGTNPWKVNIPNEISVRQLKENLTQHLRKVSDQKSTWSEDANVTSRAVAAHVLQALNDATLASDQ